jgi:hypothetical protein
MESQNEETITNAPIIEDVTMEDKAVVQEEVKETEEKKKEEIEEHKETVEAPVIEKQQSPVVNSPIAAIDATVVAGETKSPERQEQAPKPPIDGGRFGFKSKVSAAMKECISKRYHLNDEQLVNFSADKYTVTYLSAFGKATSNIATALEKHKDLYADKDASAYRSKGTAATVVPELLYVHQYMLLLPCLTKTDSNEAIEWNKVPPPQKNHSHASAVGKRTKYIETIRKPAEPVIDFVLGQQNFVDDLKKKTEKKEKTDEMNKQQTNKSKQPIYNSNNKQPSSASARAPQEQGKNGTRPPPPPVSNGGSKPIPNGNKKISFNDQTQVSPLNKPLAPKAGTSAAAAPSSSSLGKAGQKVASASPSSFDNITIGDVYKMLVSLDNKVDELQKEVQEVKASINTLKASNNGRTTASPQKSRQAAARAPSSDNKAGYNENDNEVALEVAQLGDLTDAILADIAEYHKQLPKTVDDLTNQREREKKKAGLPFFPKIADFGPTHFEKWKYVLHFLSLVDQKDLFGKNLDHKIFTPNNTARMAYALLDTKDMLKTIGEADPLNQLLTYRQEDETFFINKSNYDALLKQIKFIYISFVQRETAQAAETKKSKSSGGVKNPGKKPVPQEEEEEVDYIDDAAEDNEYDDQEYVDEEAEDQYQEEEQQQQQEEEQEEQEQDPDEQFTNDDDMGPGQYRGYNSNNKQKVTKKLKPQPVCEDLDNDDHENHASGSSKAPSTAKAAPVKPKDKEESTPGGVPRGYLNAVHTMMEGKEAERKKRQLEAEEQATKPASTKTQKLTTAANPAPRQQQQQFSEFDDDDFGDDDEADVSKEEEN